MNTLSLAARWGGVVLTVIGCVLAFAGHWLWIPLVLFGVGWSLARAIVPDETGPLTDGLSIVFGSIALMFFSLIYHLVGYPVSATVWYAGLSLVVSAVSVVGIPRTVPRSFLGPISDRVVGILPFILLLICIGAVVGRNGYTTLPDGREQVFLRGYHNGDTATFFALTWRAQEQGQLSHANPFAAGTSLEYPTLLHGTIGILLGTVGGDVTRIAWFLVLFAGIGTISVLAVLARRLVQNGSPWWIGGVLAWVLAFSIEAYIYPQSHTFLMGPFVAFILCLFLADQEKGMRRWMLWSAGIMTALVLLFSNAVLGTAALGIALLAPLFSIRRQRSWDRIGFACGSAALLALFMFFPPGNGDLGGINVPYTVFPDVFMVAAPLLGLFWILSRNNEEMARLPTMRGIMIGLPVLAAITMFFSKRDIVAENASRFLYLALLVLWPVIVPSVQEVVRDLTARARGRNFAALLTLLLACAVVLLPPAASIARAAESLLLGKASIVTTDDLAVFSWIRENTAPSAVFVRMPGREESAPLALPMFTGRSLARSDFWLSPDDALAETQRQAITEGEFGNLSADYLFCESTDSCPAVGEIVFSSDGVRVQALPR